MKKLFLTDGPFEFYDLGGGCYQALGTCNVDTDGTGPHHGDKTAENQTSLRPSVNADAVAYGVVNPVFGKQVRGVVLGSKGHVLNLDNGKNVDIVWADVGPHGKFGEVSRCAAIALGVDPDPNFGGSQSHRFLYTFWPGVVAPGYKLQPIG